MARRRFVLIAGIAGVLIVAVAIWSLASPTIYQAKATLYASINLLQIGTALPQEDAGSKGSAKGDEGDPAGERGIQFIQPDIRSVDDRTIDSYAELAEGNRVLGMAAKDLGEDETASSLAGKVSVTHPPSSQLIEITARDGDPEHAAAIANAVGKAMAKFVANLERPIGGGQSPVNLKQVEPAVAPSSPASPKVTRNILFAIVAGLALGLGAAIVREIFDTRLREPATVRDLVDLPVLSTIDFDRRLRGHSLLLQQSDLDEEQIAQERLADLWTHSRVAEEFRQLRVNLQFFNFEGGRRSIMVTSSKPGEGKTTTAGNLAITMALAGESIALVDCDLRKPTVHRALGLEARPGVTDVLIGRATLDEALVSGRRLSVLPAGSVPPNPTELLGSQAMADLVAALHERFSIVVIDTPPTLPFADPAVLAPLCGTTLMVVRINHTHAAELERAVGNLRSAKAHLCGTVVNMVRGGRAGAGYYYSGYYSNGDDAAGSQTLSGSGFDLVPRATNGHVAGARPEIERREA